MEEKEGGLVPSTRKIRSTSRSLMLMSRSRSRRLMLMMVLILVLGNSSNTMSGVWGMWCVARSDASDEDLQRGLDYACAAGADCSPLLEMGLCFLPNTLQAHASYAYNSFYQRSRMVPGSCDFSATATLAKTDPSYGSCVYPASPSTAGLVPSTTTGATPRSTTGPYGNTTPMTPTFTSPPGVGGGGGGGGGGGIGLNPNTMGPPITTTTDSKATSLCPSCHLLVKMSLFLVLSFAVF